MLALIATIALAQDIEVAHQGRLLGPDGNALSGSHTLRVRLLDGDDAPLHDETFGPLTLQDGYYAVVLGRGATPLQPSDFAGDVWLELTVDPGTPNVYVLSPNQKLTDVPGTNVAGTGQSAQTAAFSCKVLHDGGVTTSGLYWIDPVGGHPVQTWCDMDTDGGGWTLVSHAWAEPSGYHNNNHHSLRCGGGDFRPDQRLLFSGAIQAVELAQASTEFGIAMDTTGDAVASGDMEDYDLAYKFPIPNPAAVTFANHSYYNPSWSAATGPCVAVTVTRIDDGASGETYARYTLTKSLGASWSDTYPTGYGAVNVSDCRTFGNGPVAISIHSGSFRGSAVTNDANECDVPRGSTLYNHRGNWHATGADTGGSSSLWLR